MSDTPKVRFGGFTDAWEQRKLGNFFDMTIPNNTLSRAELTYDGGEVQSVHYGDVLIKYGAFIDAQVDDIPYITGGKTEDYKAQLLREGDIIFADTAEDETTGKAAEIGNLQGKAVVSGLHTIVCRPSEKLAKYYMGYYLNSDSFHGQLLPLMQGIKVLSLSRRNLSQTMVMFPTSKAEQASIGTFFRNLDHLITLHQRKCDETKELKKCMLQKMFPKNGEKIPEIRFAGFNDVWKQCKFKNVTEIKSASRVHKDDWRAEGVPFYRSSDVMSVLNGRENKKVFISEELYEKLSKISGRLEKGDVLVTGGGSIGRPYIVPDDKPLYTKDADLLWIKTNKNIDSYFIYTFFFCPAFRTYLESISHVGTIAHYTITQLGDTPIMLPGIDEQMKIGNFFHNIDCLITLHQRKCDKLKEVKKFMLQNMFPQKG